MICRDGLIAGRSGGYALPRWTGAWMWMLPPLHCGRPYPYQV